MTSTGVGISAAAKLTSAATTTATDVTAATTTTTTTTANVTAVAARVTAATTAAGVTTATPAGVTATATATAAAVTCLSPSDHPAGADAHHETAKQSRFPRCSIHNSSSEKVCDAIELAQQLPDASASKLIVLASRAIGGMEPFAGGLWGNGLQTNRPTVIGAEAIHIGQMSQSSLYRSQTHCCHQWRH